jgi:hypothetical protein
MSAVTLAGAPPATRSRSALWPLAAVETKRYARQPLFLTGAVVTLLVTAFLPADKETSTYYDAIVPAAALGVLGLVAMASMVRGARTLSRSAGAAPVPERVQTGALALACLLPFTIGLIWFAGSVLRAHANPPAANGFPFGDLTASWKLAILFGMGTMSTLGGPLLGVLIGRWLPRRGTAPLAAVLLVAATIVMQGIFAPLRTIRVIMPYTNWGGPSDLNSNRELVLTGSPQWWVVYLACLCGLAVTGALWHDRAARGRRLAAVGAVLIAAALATCLLAMFTGVHHTIVNPLPNP